jgi:GH25 family lysozyme M1 (1,4-beta-N-acetylmuramidase)
MYLDLSNNNGEPNWHALKQAGVEGVWLKATEGDFFLDQTFLHRRAMANAHDIRVGAYHFARPDRGGARQEAEFFCTAVKVIDRRDLRPVLDYERTTDHGGDELWIRDWNKTVKSWLAATTASSTR